MKKIISLALVLCMALEMLAGCSGNTSLAYTFSVDNGDSVRVELDTTDGYSITSDVPFTISCDDEILSQGTFIQASAYEGYVTAAETDSNAEILETEKNQDMEYIFWNYNDSEFNYAIMLAGSNTAILLGNNVSEESARECFSRLTITVDGE